MDEDEYLEYLAAIDQLEDRESHWAIASRPIKEQLRDEHGHRVSGCYWVAPYKVD